MISTTTPEMVLMLYKENRNFFVNKAKYVLSHFYYVPLEIEDLISNCLHELIIISKKFDDKKGRTFEEYLFTNIKYIMYSYCRQYTNKNNCILNNYIDFDLLENLYDKTYDIHDFNLKYLSTRHQNIIDDLFIQNMTTKDVAKKYNTTSTIINKEIIKIRSIIQEKIDNSFN